MKYGYMRTSKTTQELALQRDTLEKYGVSEIYEEQVSGVKNRPQLEKLLSKLQKGDTLVVWKLDRLGRTAKELVNLVDAFDKRGIHFVSLTENIDTVSPTGKFLVTILCAMAAMERDVLIMRTKAGLEAAKKRGRVGGRKAHACFERTVHMTFDDIEDAVQESWLNHIREFNFTKIEREQHTAQKDNTLKIELVKVEEEISGLMAKLAAANDTLFKYINERIEELDTKRQELERKLGKNKENELTEISSELVIRALTEWDNFEFEEKKLLAQSFIEKVVIYNGDMEIVYK